MSGNVWEWCWDVDPDHSDRRYNRGGGYNNDDYCCEVDGRYDYGDDPDHRDGYLGFRIVCFASN